MKIATTEISPVSTKRKVPILAYRVSGINDYQTLTNTRVVQKNVFEVVLEAIDFGIKNNKNEVDIYKIDSSVMYLTLHRSDWMGTLTNALRFFVAEEDYHRACQCRDLISQS